jgi:hypothetical protein
MLAPVHLEAGHDWQASRPPYLGTSTTLRFE